MLITNLTSQIYDAALAILYPQACAICGASVESRHDGVVCSRCWSATQLFRDDDTFCWKCGALNRATIGRATISEEKRQTVRCGRCDDDVFTVARACGPYDGALRASILELKRQPHVARRVAHLMSEVQKRAPLNSADLIVPVPLHADRERERGFNQARALAHELARLSGLPVDEHSVVRRIHTERHRAGMDAKARRKSVAGAFAVRHTDLISGKRVLLIDDVFTTGATVSACAAVLIDAGAEDVFILTIARAQ
jgi:ComF family protein